ncbi:MAG: ROK family protein [Acidobacteriota bacterium]
MAGSTIGVDFGGTGLKAAVVVDGRVETEARRDTGAGRPAAAILDDIAELARELDPQPDGLGLAIPGEVDEDGACWRLPNVPHFEQVRIAAELEKRLGCRVAVENDATTAAWAELRHGHGRDVASFLLFTLGTGVGGGLVLDGRVRRGRHGFAGEVGHVFAGIDDDIVCACDSTGCLEVGAGTSGLQRSHERAGGASDTSPKAIAEAAEQGDAAGLSAFDAMGVALGRGIASIQAVLDLDALVFTGGIAASMHLIEPSLRRTLEERAYAPPLAAIPFLRSELGGRAGVIGAAELLRS